MSDRPIIFSAPMVRALLAGRKTQTRRLVRFPGWACGVFSDPLKLEVEKGDDAGHDPEVICENTGCLSALPLPYAIGDRLYVRESAHIDGNEVNYAADMPIGMDLKGLGYRPSIHMPRWASRIVLDVTDVRVQRLKDISEEDAVAEGATSRPHCSGFGDMNDGWSMDWSSVGQPSRFARDGKILSENDVSLCSAVSAFAGFINQLHDPLWNHKGDGIFAENPWIVAVSFTVNQSNIDRRAA